MKRFSVKVSLLFLVLLIIMGLAQVLISVRITEKRQIEADQLVNLNLARDMAQEIEPFVREGIDIEQIGSIMHYMMVMNPKIEIYLLDEGGKILAFFTEPGIEVKQDRVDVGPVQEFLQGEGTFPIYGSDPRNPRQKKHFSAAPVVFNSERRGYLYVVLRSSLYDRAIRTLRDRYLFSTFNKSLLLSFLGVGIIGLVLFTFMTKRLQRVSKAVKDFERGELSRRIDTNARDEIGYLAQAFNQMADTIASNLEELKHTDKLRRELIANISHDLKSPLASIQGYVETLMIKKSTIKAEERLRLLGIVLNSTKSLNKLVEQLFELSKLDAKQVEPLREPFSMTELAQDVFMKFKPRAEGRDITLTARLPETMCFVNADIAMIERVMSNLLDNALKHTPVSGAVKIEVKPVDSSIRFTVRDSGRGIPPEEIPHVFERFYIVDKSRSRSEQGSGLGLSISKKIMELHRSTIIVESQGNQGSTFYFDLPVEAIKKTQ
jgi:signal transduction histidine kinase